MLKTLVSIRLTQTLNGLLGKNRKQVSRGRTIGFAILMVYVLGCVAAMFSGIFAAIAEPFYEAGLAWLYFAFTALLDLCIMLFLGMFAAKSQLYEARDSELLLSMPIRPGVILASRMTSLLTDCLVADLLVAGPAGVMWLLHCPVNAAGAACFVVLFLLLPFLALALSCVVGFVLTRLTAKIRNKTLVSTVLYLAFFVAYFYFYNKIMVYIQSLVLDSGGLESALSGIAPLVWMGRACAQGDFIALAGCVGIIAAVFALVYGVLSASFTSMATAKTGAAKRVYRSRAMKQTSPESALLRKELGRLGSSANYMINGGLGAVFLVALPIALLVKKAAILELIVQAGLPALSGGMLATVCTALICLILGTGSISAPALSLEGKSIWIPQSLPVRGRDVLLAKACCQMVVMLPAALFSSVLCAAALAPDVLSGLLMVVVSMAFGVFTALIGLWEGMRHPMLDWVSEAQVVKQSTAVLLAMLFGWGGALLGGALMGVLTAAVHPAVGLAAGALVFALADWLLLRALNRRGDAILADLK